MILRSPEVLVIGAGIAGVALACELHRRGLDVLLVERSPSVQKIFKGEYLQPFAANTLREFGLGDVLGLPDAQKIRELRFTDLGPDNKTVISQVVLGYPN